MQALTTRVRVSNITINQQEGWVGMEDIIRTFLHLVGSQPYGHAAYPVLVQMSRNPNTHTECKDMAIALDAPKKQEVRRTMQLLADGGLLQHHGCAGFHFYTFVPNDFLLSLQLKLAKLTRINDDSPRQWEELAERVRSFAAESSVN